MRDDCRAPTTECTVALRIFLAGVNCAVRTRARARWKTLDPSVSETWLYASRRLKTVPQPLAVKPDHDPERRWLSPANDRSGRGSRERQLSERNNDVVASDGEGVSNRSNSTPSAASNNGDSEASDSDGNEEGDPPGNASRNHLYTSCFQNKLKQI